MPLKQIKTSYNAGELSGYMDGREDINKYHSGCSKLINATVLPHGGFTKRPGTEYIATAPNKCKLIPFEFSVDDTLMLEWSNLLLRFYKDGASVTSSGAGTEDLSSLDNIVAHWKLNDDAATTTVVDADGATHNGTASSNTEDLTATGKVLACFNLNGTDAVEVNDNDAFSFDDSGSKPFSIAAWVYVIPSNDQQVIVSKFDNQTGSELREWTLYMDSSERLYFAIVDESANVGAWVRTINSLTSGWHFVVATYDSRGGSTAANGMTLYVDGSVITDTTITNSANYVAMENTNTKVTIGAYYDTAGTLTFYWKDKIDNVALFSDVLTAAEVTSLYSTAGTYEIATPYTSAEAFEIHTTQSADVMYIAHKNHPPQKLSRVADTNWTIADIDFTGGPFLDENTTAASLVGFARTGGTARSGYYFPAGATGTLTATAHSPFNSSMVGALWLVKHTRPDNKTSTFDSDTNATPTALTNAIRTKGDYTVVFDTFVAGDSTKLWRKEGNGDWQEFRSFSAATSFSATEDKKDTYYLITRSVNTINGTFTAKNQVNRGIVKITSSTSPTVMTVEVVDAVLSNNSSDAAVTTSMWAEGAWNDYRGFPRTAAFYEDRLWWASSTNNPDTLWASKSGLYEDMEFTDLGVDDDALIFPLNDNEVSQIQWMFARQVMAVGAANKEYRLSANNPDDPITPADRKATPQTAFGSDDIQPIILNNAIFFFQRQGRKLRAMKYDSITENFEAADATMLAYSLFESAPTCMAVQRVPDSIIWTVRTDGVLPTFTYEPDEEVSGWARQITENSADVDTPVGFFESAAVIHGSSEDEIWVSVRRVLDSGTVYYVERFKPRDWGSDIEDAFFVDSGVTYDGALTSTVTAAHLVGKTVAVFADGVVFDDAVVAAGGVVTLKLATVATQAEVVQYGLPYTMKARTMRLSVPQEGNTFQTRIKRIHATVVRYIRSLLGSAGQEYGGTEYLQDLNATYSTSSQDTSENARLTEGGFSEDAYTTIVSDDPVPFTVLSTIISFEVEERR